MVVPPTAAIASNMPLQPAGAAVTKLEDEVVPLPDGIVTVTPQLLDGLDMFPVIYTGLTGTPVRDDVVVIFTF